MTVHVIKAERRTLHGHFSGALPPILSVAPGDTVQYSTLDAGWGLEPFSRAQSARRLFEPRQEGLDDGHALCGPIEVRGAGPDMTLEVQIGPLRPGPWGYTRAGGAWPADLNRRLGVAEGDSHIVTWTLDADAMIGYSGDGHSVALGPFMGVLGMPPPEPGVHPTAPPRASGGNIDCKELVQGTTLFLPVTVPGGLFSVGDGHAAQGDGEVGGTAIECPMERVDLTFGLRREVRLTTPRAKTPTAWLTFGFHEDLDEAMSLALADMLELMTQLLGMTRKEALAYAGVVVDLRITQVVNGVCGVHAVLPHGAIRD